MQHGALDLMDDRDDDQGPSIEERVHADVVKRAEEAFEKVRCRPVAGAAPQLRTVRAHLTGAASKINLVLVHLQTLYTLAYDRPAAVERVNVKGGPRDYALDTHGDPKARELYSQVALEAQDLVDVLGVADDEMMGFLTKGGQPSARRRRGDHPVSTEALVEALAAQHRRDERDEGTPPLVAQPDLKPPAIDVLLRQLTALEGVLGKLHPRLAGSDRGQLTPAEQLAHRAAVEAFGERRDARLAKKRGRHAAEVATAFPEDLELVGWINPTDLPAKPEETTFVALDVDGAVPVYRRRIAGA